MRSFRSDLVRFCPLLSESLRTNAARFEPRGWSDFVYFCLSPLQMSQILVVVDTDTFIIGFGPSRPETAKLERRASRTKAAARENRCNAVSTTSSTRLPRNGTRTFRRDRTLESSRGSSPRVILLSAGNDRLSE